jgi:AcrR family transcriptional regulator
MGKSDERLGLRERKRVRTREGIRRAAIGLVEVNGYAKTTIEQIAEVAEVSHATFFRYFPTKDSALLASGLDELAIESLMRQPAGIPTLKAFREAMEAVKTTLSTNEWAFERTCLHTVLSIPELREPQYAEFHRIAARLAEAECLRLGREPDDFEVQVFFGALNGAVRTVLDSGRNVPAFLFEALDFIEAGMPLH